jgi:hypothetical protein
MLYRLTFDDEIFATLNAKIASRAKGGSLNKALQALVIEWSAIEDDKKLTNPCQVPVKTLTIQDNEDQLDDALAELDDAW